MDNGTRAEIKLGVWTTSKQQVFSVLKYSQKPSRGAINEWPEDPLYFNDIVASEMDKVSSESNIRKRASLMTEQLERRFEMGMQGHASKLYSAMPTRVQGRYIALFKNKEDDSYTAHPVHCWHTVDIVRNVHVDAAEVDKKINEDADLLKLPMSRRGVGADEDAEEDADEGEFMDYEEIISDDDEGSSLDSVGRAMLATMAPAIDNEDALPDIFQSKPMEQMYKDHATDEPQPEEPKMAVKRERDVREEPSGKGAAPSDKKMKREEKVREISEAEIVRLVSQASDGMSASRLISKFQASFRGDSQKKKQFQTLVKKVLSKAKNSKGQSVLKVKLGYR